MSYSFMVNGLMHMHLYCMNEGRTEQGVGAFVLEYPFGLTRAKLLIATPDVHISITMNHVLQLFSSTCTAVTITLVSISHFEVAITIIHLPNTT
jgi:hypothetical protein